MDGCDFTNNGCFSVHLPQHKGVQPPLYLNRQNAAVSAGTQNKRVKKKVKTQDCGKKKNQIFKKADLTVFPFILPKPGCFICSHNTLALAVAFLLLEEVWRDSCHSDDKHADITYYGWSINQIDFNISYDYSFPYSHKQDD